MAKAHSTDAPRPEKPYPDFPLGWHRSGYWIKRIRGKLHYFGPRNCDWRTALEEYQSVRDDLHAGRTPRANGDGTTVRFLCNHFLTDREHRLTTGELTQRSFADYRATCERIVEEFGHNRLVADLHAEDFLRLREKLAAKWGPTTLANEIGRIRAVFNYAWKAHLIESAVRFGPTFAKPSRRVLRQHRQKKGERLFTPEQIHALLELASEQVKAMILLGVNCGLGNADCSRLSQSNLDMAGGWLDYPRNKTAIPRRAKLWRETIAALDVVIANRREPKNKEHSAFVFVTKYGSAWHHEGRRDAAITHEFRKLLDTLKIYRPGLSFYTLRHCFETIAGESKDQVAVDAIMGHARDDMASVYREKVSDARLSHVADHVRTWLYGGRATS